MRATWHRGKSSIIIYGRILYTRLVCFWLAGGRELEGRGRFTIRAVQYIPNSLFINKSR